MHVTEFTKPSSFSPDGLTNYFENNPNPLDEFGYGGVLVNYASTGPTTYERDLTETKLVVLSDVSLSPEKVTEFQALLDGDVAHHHALKRAMDKVDRKTKALFAQGFRYKDGVIHSMSQNAQITYLGMFVARDIMETQGMFTEEFPVSSKDNMSHTILNSKGDLSAFYNGLVQAVATYKHGGTLIKASLKTLTTEQLLAFEDPRPLEPIQV